MVNVIASPRASGNRAAGAKYMHVTSHCTAPDMHAERASVARLGAPNEKVYRAFIAREARKLRRGVAMC